MVRIDRNLLTEPPSFHDECRAPGNAWLLANPEARRPRDFWSPFRGHLSDAFRELCAYSAMYEPVGTVDHFVSCNENRDLAYEWANYRFASGWINSSKSRTVAEQILDPLQVGDGWFRILLPSLQLVITERVPAEFRERAQETLRRLHLVDDERVIRQRRKWLALWESGSLSLDGLRQMAPLIAEAVSAQSPLP